LRPAPEVVSAMAETAIFRIRSCERQRQTGRRPERIRVKLSAP
jgi:hypothetical protein